MQICYDLHLGQILEKTRAKKKSFWRHFMKFYAPIRKTFGAYLPDISAPYFFGFWLTIPENTFQRSRDAIAS